VPLDQATHNRQPETKATLSAIRSPWRLLEHVEDAGHQMRGDAHAVVTHPHDTVSAVAVEEHVDAPADVRVLGGIGEEVGQTLAQAHLVRHHVDAVLRL
jgi:hypothetical protein